ncbi:CapA family protein [Bacteroides oleiciplenus]|uniref:Capsule synthesis protein CapA domain-containing protein n=1 Tax=Bacteroides oleiciplenus YIT 12058 TaxID=742727 RepID=K9DW04_9BACE|nr:CapA family protein [Bacteroides oleiciplenus]EKU89154.1 hypothetical protein HMPREF9447_03479 [Bacteroides oleiciplenus YIT 12058]
MRRTFPLALLFFFVSCSSVAQEQVVPEASDTVFPAKVTLLFVGDLMQHKAQLEAARTSQGTYDYSPCFSLVKEQISKADIAIANLEVPLGGKPYTGYPAFSAPDEFLYAIQNAGFDILLTANNHCLDRGKKGLERTILMLDSLHIPYTGTYRNKEERHQHYPLLIHKNGFRIAFLNYTYDTNGIKPSSPNIVNYIDKKVIQQDIDTARAWQPGAIIACMHWGNEYQSLPSREQRQLADWLLEQGVTHIIGSHPHVIQPMELRTDSLTGMQHAVVYSLGNFISNMSQINTDGGLIFTLELEKDTVASLIPHIRVRHCGYNLVWTARPTLSNEKNYIIYPTDSIPASKLPDTARNSLNIFVKNARKLLQQHNVGIREDKK